LSWLVWIVVGLAMVLAAITFARIVYVHRHIAQLVRDQRTRIVHGLEHATAALIQREHGLVLGGISWRNRFQLHRTGEPIDPDALAAKVRVAVASAIERVKAGEHELAYTPQCSTSLAVGQLGVSFAMLAAGVFAWAMSLPAWVTLIALIAAIDISVQFTHFLGILAQRWFTVSTAFSSATVRSVKALKFGDGTMVHVDIDVEPAARDGGAVIANSPWP
jgi:hypothetical protein